MGTNMLTPEWEHGRCKGSRVVFNIAGYKYRLLVEIVYRICVIYVKYVGTHRQYDKIDAEEYDDEPIQGYQD
jgi:mRNA-degrading endonuclease HigB of HigAB toxin-antitoxin module